MELPQDVDGAKRVASAVMRDCLKVLGLPHPTLEPPQQCSERQYQAWRIRWLTWARDRARELRFLNSPRSILWCEILDMDKDDIVARLRDRGLLYDHREVVPEEARPLGRGNRITREEKVS